MSDNGNDNEKKNEMKNEKDKKQEPTDLNQQINDEITGAKKKSKKKKTVVYCEDNGQTIYSMAALEGRTPEDQEELDKKRKNIGRFTKGETRAIILAAFSVYGPMLLFVIGAFALTALFLYFFLI